MLTLENDNKLIELRKQLTKDEMTTKNNVANEVKSVNTKRVNELIGNYHNNGYNKLNNNSLNTTNVINNNYVKKEVKRGQIWYVDFGRRQGSLQSGIRPAIVESNDINNKHSNIINVSPLTSKMAKASNIPVHVPIEGFGLKEPSVILIEQGTPIDVRYQLLTYIGTVDELVLQKVKRAREIQLGDLQEKTQFEKLSNESQNDIIKRLKMIKTYELTIQTMYMNKLDVQQIRLMEDRLDEALNGLRYYCNKNQLQFEEIYEMEIGENKLLAL